MGRMLSGLAALFAYFCVGTILAVAIIAGYAASQGYLDKQKLADMLAVARGATLGSADKKDEPAPAKPVQMLSIEEMDQRRMTMTRHLELREQSVQNALEQIASEREKLLKERQSFDMLVAAFRKEKDETASQELAEGQEEARAILETIKPKLAKDLILKMIAADEKQEVVAILTAMPIGRQKKIIEQFTDDEEKKKLDEILRLIRQGSGDARPTDMSADAAGAPDTRQP